MSNETPKNGSGKYQLLPPLSTEERDTLRRLIAADGVRVPIEVDENGDILDGHNREAIARELGVPCPRVVVRLPTETHKQAYAIKANLGRRQLSPEQVEAVRETQRDLAIRLNNEGLPQAKIGEILGVDQRTVGRWMAQSIESNGSIRHVPNASVDLRLKLPPALHPTILQRAQAGETHAAIAADLKVTPRRVGQVIAKHRRKDEKRASRVQAVRTAEHAPLVVQMDAMEFLEQEVEAGSVDLLLTDPPYMTDVLDIASFTHEWVPLAMSRLKDSGRAYIFTGAYPQELYAYLDVLLAQERFTLANVLVWTYRNTLGPAPANDYKQNWQACFYLRGPEAPPLDCEKMTEQFSVQDVNAPDARTGLRDHTWEKPEELAKRFIRHSTHAGDMVLDPFAGTGTFLAAAAEMGRVGFGSEIAENMLAFCEARGVEVRRAE